MGWLDEAQEKGGSGKYYSTKEGQEYTFEIFEINIVDKGERFNIINKDYAYEITTTEGKILSIGTVMGEIALRKLGSVIKEEFGIENPLIGEILNWRHPKHGVIELKARGKRVKVSYDRSKNAYKTEIEDVVSPEDLEAMSKEQVEAEGGDETPPKEETPPF